MKGWMPLKECPQSELASRVTTQQVLTESSRIIAAALKNASINSISNDRLFLSAYSPNAALF
jgi:hypothetical protein